MVKLSSWVTALSLVVCVACGHPASSADAGDPSRDGGAVDGDIDRPDARADDAAIVERDASSLDASSLDATIEPDAGTIEPDAGGDDAGPDAHHDGGVDASHDAGVDACSDRDLDGVCDALDDCPDAPDRAQQDTDHDHVGDACECAAVTCPGTACRAARCDMASGACVPDAPRVDGTGCDDDDACTRSDACRGGVCVGASPVVCSAVDACHATGTCDARTGECAPGTTRPDGTTCDDASLCTLRDVCRDGSCVGEDPVVCAPVDACHSAGTCVPSTGLCSSASVPCTSDVHVRVLDASGRPFLPAPFVRAFSGGSATPYGAGTDSLGEALVVLPPGSYRFRVVLESGTELWSGTSDHCTTPGCTSAEIRAPAVSTSVVAMSWDPYVGATYGGGEIRDEDAHVERGGIYIESWAIDHYGRTGAALVAAHDHVGDLTGVPGGYGNASNAENQHAFGEMLQGFYIRLSTRGRFDLLSLDYRIRDDADPTHVSAVPGVDPHAVQIWITAVLDVGGPAGTGFTTFPIGSLGAEMTYWGTLVPGGLTNVVGVYVTSTANVSFDNVALRPR